MPGLLTTVAAFSLLVGSTALAKSTDGDLAKLVFESREELEAQMMSAIKSETGFDDLRDFKIDWSTLKCLVAPPSGFEPKTVGSCVVAAHAFQVASQFAVTLTQGSLVTTALYVEFE